MIQVSIFPVCAASWPTQVKLLANPWKYELPVSHASSRTQPGQQACLLCEHPFGFMMKEEKHKQNKTTQQTK